MRYTRDAVAMVAAVSLLLAACGDDDDSGGGGEPVAAGEAKIETAFTGDGTSFVGDREIIEGTVTVVFSNEADDTAVVGILWYETGSSSLDEELEFLSEEGDWGLPGAEPAPGCRFIEFEGDDDLGPGSHSWTLDLAPCTYLFDVGDAEDYRTTGVWRAAVIEVVAE